MSILYIILALLGISFLVFIHELGHYLMARRAGIIVEVFSIGFGKSILEWQRKGVKWKIGILPFGGYVKMAGMEKQGGIEPSQVEGGFLGAKPWSQIKVAAMGPIVNIIFAFLAFSFLWVMGGRDKHFSEYTHHIGWVEEDAGIYSSGIRPGDAINKVRGQPFKGFEQLLYSALYGNGPLSITGCEIDYLTGDKTPFTYQFPIEKNLDVLEKIRRIQGSMTPAQYLIYDKMPNGAPNELLPGSPLVSSGITYGDRIIWADGALIFSKMQLMETINRPFVLLTVKRADRTFLTRVPRLNIADLRLTADEKDEIDDWRDEAKLIVKVDELKFLPYSINANLEIQGPLGYIDEKSRSKLYFEAGERAPGEVPLEKGDQILAVQGEKVGSGYALLKEFQTPKTLLIVEKIKKAKPLPWTDADKGFEASFDIEQLQKITHSIGTDALTSDAGSLRLLKPITPVPMQKFSLTPEQGKLREERLEKYQKAIEKITDSKQREEAEKNFQHYRNRLMLGITLQDKTVSYNPSPIALFGDVFQQIYKTLFGLFAGSISPKHLAGPIGIVQVIQYGWSVGAKEALYWLGMISLNLGLINLLPIPMLDGGHIMFAAWEGITRKPLAYKTRERLIFPFILLVIAFFIYVTYHDLARIFSQFF